jgi:hypothetical protein
MLGGCNCPRPRPFSRNSWRASSPLLAIRESGAPSRRWTELGRDDVAALFLVEAFQLGNIVSGPAFECKDVTAVTGVTFLSGDRKGGLEVLFAIAEDDASHLLNDT